MQPLGTKQITLPPVTKKKSCNLSEQQNNHATSPDKKNHASSLDKKKITQTLGTKKITEPLGTKKSHNLSGQNKITKQLGKKNITFFNRSNCVQISIRLQIAPNGTNLSKGTVETTSNRISSGWI